MYQAKSGQQVGDVGQILGILQQMRDDFKASLEDATKEEDEAIATFNSLMGSKQKEIGASTREMEEKEGLLATQQLELADNEEDLADSQTNLAKDEKFLAELQTSCADQTRVYDAESKEHEQETIAIQ